MVISDVINDLRNEVHDQNYRWWLIPGTRMLRQRNVGELLMLVVSELAEAMEGARRDLKDTHLPERTMLEVELADAVIRILDMAGGLGLDLGGAVEDKLAYNKERSDHRDEDRLAPGGKKW
jgi:NTP pyrophosphatase (non-canonical NTP hydrolase)